MIKRSGKTTSGGGGGGDESNHAVRTWTERDRERRKKMKSMFSTLQALLPQLPAKANRSTMIDEAAKYIKSLEHTLQTFERQSLDKLQSTTSSLTSNRELATDTREAFLADFQHQTGRKSKNLMTLSASLAPARFQTWFSPNVVINMCGDDAQISVCSPRKPALLTTIFHILEKHKLDVVSAHISSDQYRCMYMINVHTDRACDNFPEALSVENTFKLAAGELNLWLLSC